MTSPYKIKRDRFSSHRLVADYLIGKAKEKMIEVLDLGCDIGFIGTLSSNSNIKFTGVDISGQVLEKLPVVYNSKIELDLNDKDWNFDKKFDYIVFTDVIEHLDDPDSAMSQIASLLKPKGVLILSVPNFDFILVRPVSFFNLHPQHSRGLFDRTHIHHYTQQTTTKLVNKSGLRIIDEKYTNPPIYLIAPKLFANPIGNALYYFIHKLVEIKPELFAYQLVFLCRK